jgi:hypothetical protein
VFQNLFQLKELYQDSKVPKVEPPQVLELEFDPKKLPEYDSKKVHPEMLENSAKYYELGERVKVAEEAIGVAKENAGRPTINLIAAYEPADKGTLGLVFEMHPFRFREAEAQISEYRAVPGVDLFIRKPCNTNRPDSNALKVLKAAKNSRWV